MFRKILIANREEIAVRIERACRELGVRSVAVYSDVDRASLHVRLSDEAYAIGPAPSRESYLSIEKILAVAHDAQCDAVHPGYGFLSENPVFARACADAGVTFIGPSPEAMERLGSKTAARNLAHEIGVPTVAGTLKPLDSAGAALAAAKKIGFPVVLKAVAGGGGKGMRLVEHESELDSAWRDASSEAQNAFGDSRLYLEKYLSRARHIEIQILGDRHGHLLYLGDRECSVQRRYQKVIEEAPSPIMTPELRREMGEAAVKLARAGGYKNAGTVEFLVDTDRKFYFLEMNTRLQVEHPVTEMVTGLDLVRLQLLVAAGEPLPPEVMTASVRGHAIEARLYAEDPAAGFRPASGTLHHFGVPAGPGVRVDAGVASGSEISTYYDPMLAKVIGYGATRDQARQRLARALAGARLHGVTTNRELLTAILREPEFAAGQTDTGYLTRHEPAQLTRPDPATELVARQLHALAAALAGQAARRAAAPVLGGVPSGWRNVPAGPQHGEFRY
jgi:propionyl-CoA carboxylase alpha chain